MANLEELQERWKYLYQEYLPALAKARDPAQKHWTVHLDHCFARIVLDNAVGIDEPWTGRIKSPAVKNMTTMQLQSAIEVAEKLATGEANLEELDQRSLRLRGKNEKKRKTDETSTKSPTTKRAKKDNTVSSYFLPSPKSAAKKAEMEDDNTSPTDTSSNHQDLEVDMTLQLTRISTSTITPFRKQTLSLLCQIPRGRHSTYGAMADWISANSHKTCARAVGNAMRNNPFAPEVPCHRILAGDGSLGGFKGSWGEEGKYANLKHELLREEGVRFDSKGKVKGPPFRGFK